MIIEYTEDGRITHIINDPVPDGLHAVLTDAGARFLDLPPKPMPEEEVLQPDGSVLLESPGLIYAEASIFTDYISNGAVMPRPSLDLPDEVTLVVGQDVVIHDLPDPCKVILDGQAHDVNGGELTITGEMPETYDLRIEAFPHLMTTMKVTVNAA